jgi:endonuclease YncB( thermonuclease family)
MLKICSVLVLLAAPLAAETIRGPVEVVDGDSLRIGAHRIRLHGIDAPERGQPCGAENWACGDWVTATVRQRYEGREARCRVTDVDRYQRSVAVCTIDGVDIGRALVREGLAFAYRRYSWDYDLDEKQAAVAGRGLHGTQVMAPADYRAQQRGQAARPAPRTAAPEPRGCSIKGNINRRDERIYHEPGQRHYADTVISENRGERWFCSRAEAEAAGWRRSRL